MRGSQKHFKLATAAHLPLVVSCSSILPSFHRSDQSLSCSPISTAYSAICLPFSSPPKIFWIIYCWPPSKTGQKTLNHSNGIMSFWDLIMSCRSSQKWYTITVKRHQNISEGTVGMWTITGAWTLQIDGAWCS